MQICPSRPLCYSVQFLPAYLEVPGSCEMVENEKWLKVRGFNARVCRREGKTTHRTQYQHHLDSQKLDTFIKEIESPHFIIQGVPR